MNSWLRRVPAWCLAALLASCGGGGGGDPAPRGEQWSGTREDAALDVLAVAVWIDGAEITEVRESGVRSGVTGTVGPLAGLVRQYTITDGVDAINGVFLVDLAGTHMAFADEGLNFGVIQKGAASLPVYAYADLAGAWSGRSVDTDFGTNISEVTSSATCSIPAATLTCTIAISGGITLAAEFSGAFDAGFGRWEGVFTGPGSTTGNINAFLSADKTFAGAWACLDPDQFWPEDCTFLAWSR
jgi:hypothetical protein